MKYHGSVLMADCPYESVPLRKLCSANEIVASSFNELFPGWFPQRVLKIGDTFKPTITIYLAIYLVVGNSQRSTLITISNVSHLDSISQDW